MNLIIFLFFSLVAGYLLNKTAFGIKLTDIIDQIVQTVKYNSVNTFKGFRKK